MPTDAGISTGRAVARFLLASNPLAVREALASIRRSAPVCLLPDEDADAAEVVLAEVLNNCVEHAYAGARGEIEVSLELVRRWLFFEVSDLGRPMPGRCLVVHGDVRSHAGVALPEGGFGWSMIRALAQDFSYRREGGRNRLMFRMRLDQRHGCAEGGFLETLQAYPSALP
ncbi:ATP-binding protein [Rhodobacter sp. NSM]|uniref:ATP-binding protein n=1 Tax=Rhodobacter sp. NSM TaxID=3457501 RepID=UPI003FCFB7D5